MLYDDFCSQPDKTIAQKTLIKLIDYIRKKINFTEIRINEICNPLSLNMLFSVYFIIDATDTHFEAEFTFIDVTLIKMNKNRIDFIKSRKLLLNDLSERVSAFNGSTSIL